MQLGEMTWPDAKALDKSIIVPVYRIAAFQTARAASTFFDGYA